MTRPCRDLELLVGRPSSLLADAERLTLEQHLAECEACRQSHAMARALGRLVRAAPSELREFGRERAIAAALASSRARGLTARPRWAVYIGAGVAAVAALWLAVRLVPRDEAHDLLAAQQAPLVAPAHAPLQTPPTKLAASAPVMPEPDWLEVASAETREFGHAQVRLAAGTRVRFDSAASELELASGRVSVAVDARPQAPFAVVTQSFRVQVLGTQFVVTPERVDVVHGRVQVIERGGKQLARELVGGESYRARAPRTQSKRVVPAVGRAQPAANTLLQQARAALASGQVAEARPLIERAAKLASSRVDRAEAGTLGAECALLERQPQRAIRAYLAVADRYAELAAGENALFAAAQLSAREQSAASARALLQRYLARYPAGRFVDEARARLGKLNP